MSLDDLLTTARQKLPLLNQTTSLSQFTTAPQAPVSSSPVAPPPNPIPVTQTPSVQPVPQNRGLDALRQDTSQELGALAFAPSSQMPREESIDLLQLAMNPIINRGQGGTGNPQTDLERAINLRAHGISGGTSTIPSGGPTSSVDYASLPGMYGRLVDPPGGPSDLRLQQGAFQSLKQAGVPVGAILGGSYRTYAQQAANYAKDPNRFAPPGKSLHEYGLAIDVNSALTDKYRAALLANGWYQERSDEPWHYSYRVFNAPSGSQSQPRTPGGSSATSPRAPNRGSPQRVRRQQQR